MSWPGKGIGKNGFRRLLIKIRKLGNPSREMHSHHSHSGDYVTHAKDHLPDVLKTAHAKGFKTFCLTEHIPREQLSDLYPEEAHLKVSDLESMFGRYYTHAKQLQQEYSGSSMQVLVGFEAEYIRPSYGALIRHLQQQYHFDMFIGSLHHVKEIPIDYDQTMWDQAMQACGGSPVKIFEAYFDEQFAMLVALKPPVVGHFDLIRLFAKESFDRDVHEWPSVIAKVIRNIEFIVSYGGLVEINSSAVRKGWPEPYPQNDICKVILNRLASNW